MKTSMFCPIHADQPPAGPETGASSHMRPCAANDVAAAPSQEYVTFHVGKQECAIKMPAVLDVRRRAHSASNGEDPSAARGRTDFAMVDLQSKMGGRRRSNGYAVTILAQAAQRTVGLVVDAVWDVVRLSSQQIRPIRRCASLGNACWITGVATVGERHLLLLDAERLIGDAAAHAEPLAHCMP